MNTTFKRISPAAVQPLPPEEPVKENPSDEPVGAICVLRDARDIVPFLCGHYLRIGFDRLVFVDDGSSDGTFEFLEEISRRDPRVSVRRVDTEHFEQPLLMTAMANALIAEGCRIVFPFDKDEFWNIEVGAIRHAALGSTEGLFLGKWVQFVQDRSVRSPRTMHLLKARYRAPILDRRKKQLIRDGKLRLGFAMPKVAFKSGQPVDIEFGQHRLTQGPARILAEGLELFHLHLRSAHEVEYRKVHAERFRKLFAALMPEIEEMSAEARAARLDHLIGRWEMNSAEPDGCIVPEGGKVLPLVPDRRLRWLLLKAWLYLAIRHPWLVLRPSPPTPPDVPVPGDPEVSGVHAVRPAAASSEGEARSAGAERDSGRTRELVGGICAVRDARDIVPFLCGHYLGIGFDRLAFVDDNSSDGTFAFLERLSGRDPRVTVRRVELPDFEQNRLMSEMANHLIDEGCRIVFPFDKDEFWNVELPAIRRAAKEVPEGLIEGQWVQFVQDRRVHEPHFLSVLKARYRAPIIAETRGDAVRDGKPRLALTEPKVAFKSAGPVLVGFGQHRLKRGPKDKLTSGVELFHLPFRSGREITWRKTIAPRFGKMAAAAFPEINAMSPAEKAAMSERFIGSWEVNSADMKGCITGEDGVIVPLVPDTRLRWLLLRAWLYMAIRHPMILLRG